jgi:hypothetical protein
MKLEEEHIAHSNGKRVKLIRRSGKELHVKYLNAPSSSVLSK